MGDVSTQVDSVFYPFEVDKLNIVSCNRMFASSFRLIRAVMCVIAAALALANQLSPPAIVQHGWWRHRRVSSATEECDL